MQILRQLLQGLSALCQLKKVFHQFKIERKELLEGTRHSTILPGFAFQSNQWFLYKKQLNCIHGQTLVMGTCCKSPLPDGATLWGGHQRFPQSRLDLAHSNSSPDWKPTMYSFFYSTNDIVEMQAEKRHPDYTILEVVRMSVENYM